MPKQYGPASPSRTQQTFGSRKGSKMNYLANQWENQQILINAYQLGNSYGSSWMCKTKQARYYMGRHHVEIREAQPSLTRKFFRLNCQPDVVMESNSHHYSGFTQVKAQTRPRPGKGLAHVHPGCVMTGDEMPTVPPGPRGTDKTEA